MSVSGGDAGTMIGTTNAGALASVDRRGLVCAVDGSWSLDWWVGADDRWHLPAQEPAVRQRLVDSAPVVETSMRVPGGDAVARSYGARMTGVDADLVAVDVANETSIPFALALVITGRRQVRMAGTSVIIDEHVVVDFAREPSRWAVGDDAEQVREVVVGGEASEVAPAAPGRVAAVLFPLAHTARLRCTVDTDVRVERVGPARTAVPNADQVARGWQAQLGRGLVVRVPDEPLAGAVAAARAALLLAAVGPSDGASVDDLAALAGALARQGFDAEARGPLAQLASRQRLNGRFGRGPAARAHTVTALLALGGHWRLTHDQRFAESLAGPVAKAAHRVGRGGAADPALLVEALVAAADLLDGAGQPDAALAVRGLSGPHVTVGPAPPTPLDLVLDHAASGAWGSVRYGAGPAALLDRVRTGLVDEGRDPRGAVITLLGGFPTRWRGQPVEVHDAPTHFGRLSFALRWHGDRPALLWGLEPWPGGDTCRVLLTAPALDAGWSSREPAGEALLAAPAPPAPPDLQASFS